MSTRDALSRKTPSSTVALGTATLFVAIMAFVGLLVDDRIAIGNAGWSLRGTLAPVPARHTGRTGA